MGELPIVMDGQHLAAVDLSGQQFRYVKKSGSQIAAISADTDEPYGVLQNAPTAGQECTIMKLGKTKLVASENLAVGDKIGPSANGRAAKRTQGSETNKHSAGMVVDENTVAGGYVSAWIDCVNPMIPNAGVGAVAAGSTVVEKGDAATHITVLTVNTTLPAIAGGADLAVGKLLYTFPAGVVIVHGSTMSLSITQTQGNINADTPDGGLGTTIASGAVAVLGGTAAFENILTGQTFNNCTGTAEVKSVGTQLVIEAADDHTVYFNVADGWAAGGDAGALLAGTVTLNWSLLSA